MSAIELAMKIEEKDEGFSEKPYYDTKKIPTYGHGFVCVVNKKLCQPYDPLPNMSITMQESLERLRGLAEVNEQTLLNNPDLSKAYNKCNDVRKATMLSMAHQLGVYGLLKFKAMLAAIAREDWDEAHDECLDSTAARLDAPARFHRNANMLRTGIMDKYYD